jgi:type VI secretion system protein VasD
LILLLPLVVACAKKPRLAAPPPRPVQARVTIVASSDLNPDANGRPSPVVVRLYQLKADGAFGGAEFFGLFDDESRALGAELVSRSEVVISPSERRTLNLTVAPDAHFVGAMVAFRDIRNAQWRVVVPTWREGAKDVVVSIDRARVRAAVSGSSTATGE